MTLTSFVGPYLASFFVAEFVFIMQFLWKYIDDILGKGFSALNLMELIFYFAVTYIPMSLPISILLASVMVFGNMSEKYELSSMKSAGISLLRIMKPAIFLAVGTALLSLLASNVLKPQANFQFQKRFRAMKAQKPSLVIEEKIFNRDFRNFSIKVDKKEKDNKTIKDVLVYDHTENDKSLVSFVRAKEGFMYTSEDNGQFIMELHNGTSYRELKRDKNRKTKERKYPFMRTDFETWTKAFDMSEFDTENSDISLNRNREDMLNIPQLLSSIDSVNTKKKEAIQNISYAAKFNEEELEEPPSPIEKPNENTLDLIKSKPKTERQLSKAIEEAKQKFRNRKNKVEVVEILKADTVSVDTSFIQWVRAEHISTVIERAESKAGRQRDLIRNARNQTNIMNGNKRRLVLKLHEQFSFAVICIIFLFIGAPLGSIIRKGGYGYPLLFAILFYMIFIITTIMGSKLIRNDDMNPVLSAWMANLIMVPVALYLTYMALKDRKFTGFSIFSK